jgi:hypothetical protein
VRGSYESPPTEPPDPKGLLRHSPSGAKPDPADAHLLAEIVRLDRAHHRRLAGDSAEAEAVKLVARTHQSMIWDRSREVLRLRSAVRDFFPAALKAVPDLDAPDLDAPDLDAPDLDAPDALELLARAADPDRARQLTMGQLTAALRRANRREIDTTATQIQQTLHADELHRSTAVHAADAAIVTGQVALGQTLNTQTDEMGAVVDAPFWPAPGR